MHKSQTIIGCTILVLVLAFLIPLVGCGGGGTTTTPIATPTPTITTTPSSIVPSCTISSPAGTVQVQKKGSTAWTNAAAGTKLEAGDSLKTESDGSAVLLFFDGSSMEVKANSQILVSEMSITGTGSTSIGLNQIVGSTINRVAKLVDSSSKYEVDTPAAVAVVRGTVFDLVVDENGDTTIKSEEDSVSFTASGVTVTVNQGFESNAPVGGTPSTPTISTTPTPTAAPTPTPTPTKTPTVGYPGVGSQYVYKYTYGTEIIQGTWTVTGNETVTGVDCYILGAMFSPSLQRVDPNGTAFAITALTVWRSKQNLAQYKAVMEESATTMTYAETYNDGTPNMFAVGNTWSFDETQSDENVMLVIPKSYDVAVVGQEDVTVPAGTFNCYKIEFSRGGSLVKTEWWSPDVTGSFVKAVDIGTYASTETQELVSYSLK